MNSIVLKLDEVALVGLHTLLTSFQNRKIKSGLLIAKNILILGMKKEEEESVTLHRLIEIQDTDFTIDELQQLLHYKLIL